jgi:hypothetical protein
VSTWKWDVLQSPFFFFDVLYVHKKVEKGNPEKLVCQETYDFFMEVSENPDANAGYVFEAS